MSTDAHLSEDVLERNAMGLLDAARAESVRAHLAGCAACRERAGAFESESAAFVAAHDAPLFARRVQARAERVLAERAPKISWSWIVAMFVPVTAMAVVLLLAKPTLHPNAVGESYLGVKGGVRFEILSQAGRLKDGAEVHPGEALRFDYSAPEPGYVLVVGLNERGELFPYHPLEGRASAPAAAGNHVVVPGSVILDSQLGRERFYLLWSTEPLRLSDLEAAVRAGHVTLKSHELPMLSDQASVLLDKVSAP